MSHVERKSQPTRYCPPGAGDPSRIRRFGTLVKVRGDDTGGLYSVLEHTLEVETLAMPMHRHRAETKTLYVLEGLLTVRLGTDTFIAAPGTSLVVPAGAMHTMWNETQRPVRFLAVVAPGGLESYYAEVAGFIRQGGKPDMDRVLEASERYGIELDMLSLLDILERHQVQLA